MNKKEQVKQFAAIEKKTWTVNSLHFALTGVKSGAIWHNPLLDVSKSTVRRALDEMLTDGTVTGFYPIGHCFDEYCYRVK